MTEIMKYQEPRGLAVVPRGDDYELTYNGRSTKLVRGRDFSLLPGAKKPSLLQPGGEKIIDLYGLLERYNLEVAVEDFTSEFAFFFYRYRCDLVQIMQKDDGSFIEIVVKSGWGSCNTKEIGWGRKGPYDAAHPSLLKAQKRSMLKVARTIARVADIFDLDFESEEYNLKAEKEMLGTATENADDVIELSKQRRMFGVGKTYGVSADEIKKIVGKYGYTSRAKVLNRDYDQILADIKAAGKEQDAAMVGK